MDEPRATDRFRLGEARTGELRREHVPLGYGERIPPITASGVEERLAVRFMEFASVRLRQEVGAFARYCILRLESELGAHDSWIVSVARLQRGYASRVTVRDRSDVVEQRGIGRDGTLATWDAMCQIEQWLRERRDLGLRRGPRAWGARRAGVDR